MDNETRPTNPQIDSVSPVVPDGGYESDLAGLGQNTDSRFNFWMKIGGAGFIVVLFIGFLALGIYFLKPGDYIAQLLKKPVVVTPETSQSETIPIPVTPAVEPAATTPTPANSTNAPSASTQKAPVTTPVATPAPTTPPLVNVYKKIGTFTVPAGVSRITCILNWPSTPVYNLNLVMFDPSGVKAVTGYPGLDYQGGRPTVVFVDSPKPGVWTAYASGQNIPDQSGQYYFLASMPK
jgi:hypothetical protein